MTGGWTGPCGVGPAGEGRWTPRVRWVWPWGNGRPTAVRIAGFLRGRDVLHLDLDPEAFRGPILVRARPSQDLRDGLVMVNGMAVAVIAGVPWLRDTDLHVNRSGIPALARHAALQQDDRYGGTGEGRFARL